MRTLLLLTAALALTSCADHRAPSARAPAPADPWTTVGVGSVFETTTITRLEKPFAHQTQTATRQTLLARNAAEVSVKLELMSEHGTSAQDITIALNQTAAEPCMGSPATTTAEEPCTVAAGTFSCTRTTVELRQGDVAHSTVTWTAKGIPVPVKSIVTNENMTTTTELTRIVAAADGR